MAFIFFISSSSLDEVEEFFSGLDIFDVFLSFGVNIQIQKLVNRVIGVEWFWTKGEVPLFYTYVQNAGGSTSERWVGWELYALVTYS